MAVTPLDAECETKWEVVCVFCIRLHLEEVLKREGIHECERELLRTISWGSEDEPFDRLFDCASLLLFPSLGTKMTKTGGSGASLGWSLGGFKSQFEIRRCLLGKTLFLCDEFLRNRAKGVGRCLT